MATLSKMVILWWLFIALYFPFDFIAPNIMAEQKGKGYQELEKLKHLSTKMQEATSNVRITKKMKSNIYVGVLYT